MDHGRNGQCCAGSTNCSGVVSVQLLVYRAEHEIRVSPPAALPTENMEIHLSVADSAVI
jgi:hypothetical protein